MGWNLVESAGGPTANREGVDARTGTLVTAGRLASGAWGRGIRLPAPRREWVATELVNERPFGERTTSMSQPLGAIGPRVLGYAIVGSEQGQSYDGDLRWQVNEIRSECERQGLCLLEIVRDRERPHQRPLERPGLGYALRRIAAGDAGGLVVAELSRITHSVPDLGGVLQWLACRDARFVAAVPGLDTDENGGRLVVRTIIEISRWERQRLLDRTRNGMRAARRKGPASVANYPQLSERIAAMRTDGMTLQAIADLLNREGVPTVRGGAKWRPSSVQAAAGYRRPGAAHALEPEGEGARES